MDPIPRNEFVRLVRGLSMDEFGAFVADLWRARGRDVRHTTGVIAASDPVTGTSEQLLIYGDGRRVRPADPSGETADGRAVVVAPGGRRRASAGERPAIDADELYRLMRYAIGRDEANAMSWTYLDRPFYAVSRTPWWRRALAALDATIGGAGGDRAHRRVRSLPRSRSLAAAGAVLLLLAGAIGVAGSPIEPPGLSNRNEGVAIAGVTPVENATTSPRRTESDDVRRDSAVTTPQGFSDFRDPDVDTVDVDVERLPPGLGPGGVTDADALADAHARALNGQAYALEITHREYIGDRQTAIARERVTVASPTVYRSTVERSGLLRTDPLVIAEFVAYSDGTTRYERRVRDGGRVAPSGSPSPGGIGDDGGSVRDPFVDRTAAYVNWFLSVNESRIAGVANRNGTRYYWIVTEGEPFPGFRRATGSVLVDESGIVHELQRAYDVPSRSGVSILVTVRFTDIGNATVAPPPWTDEARNGTIEGSTTPPQATAANATATLPPARIAAEPPESRAAGG